jgi:hypothetical protein
VGSLCVYYLTAPLKVLRRRSSYSPSFRPVPHPTKCNRASQTDELALSRAVSVTTTSSSHVSHMGIRAATFSAEQAMSKAEVGNRPVIQAAQRSSAVRLRQNRRSTGFIFSYFPFVDWYIRSHIIGEVDAPYC